MLASSSGTELSQESEQLRSSYFTHHLLVGLRGAGDANHDGEVSIDEAYRYAYHQTLLATAGTAVGGQHVSLEVELKGHGDVPLTFPRAATAAIELPGPLEGQVLVEDRRAGAVVAETYKARGQVVRIAVAPGDYGVLVRHGDRLERCMLSTGTDATNTVDRTSAVAGSCRRDAKGRGLMTGRTRFEVTSLIGGERDDAQTLRDFGYKERWFTGSPGIAVTATREVYPRVWISGTASYAGSPEYERTAPSVPTLRSRDHHDDRQVARGEQPITDPSTARASRSAGRRRSASDRALAVPRPDATTTTETFYGVGLLGAGSHIEGRRGIGVPRATSSSADPRQPHRRHPRDRRPPRDGQDVVRLLSAMKKHVFTLSGQRRRSQLRHRLRWSSATPDSICGAREPVRVEGRTRTVRRVPTARVRRRRRARRSRRCDRADRMVNSNDGACIGSIVANVDENAEVF